MDEFLIDLAKKANWERFLPFPESFRKTTRPGEPHTKEEYELFQRALANDNKEAIDYITNIDIGIVQHNAKSIHPSITEFEFQYDFIDNYKKNLKYPQRWYLFHGSPIGNWHSILRNGIKNMSGTRFMSTGQAHGPGVYASNQLSIAYGYGGHGKTHCVAVIELLVDPAQFKKAEGIYVIPDDKLLFPRYLLRMLALPNSSGEEILNYYKKLRDGLIKPKTKKSRLEFDKKLLLDHFIEDLGNHTWSIHIDGILARLYIYNFPFTAPVLQLVNKTDNENFDSSGCFIYDFDDWSPKKDLLSVVLQAKPAFRNLILTSEEYPYLYA